MMIQHFGYDFGQGYYWGKATGAAEFIAMLENGLTHNTSTSREYRPVRISSLQDIVKQRFPMLG